mgnify:CR=1 FL=1
MAKPLVLIIEDEADFREILSTKLTSAGFDVQTAENGEEGLQKLKTIKPDLVVLDFMMPKMNGIETFAKIKEDEELKKLKVVFMTNHGEPLLELGDSDRQYAKEIGAADFFRKTDDLNFAVAHLKELCSHEN